MGSLAQMVTRHVFGLKPDVRGNVWYLDEQTVLYPAGHNIVIFNTEQKTQKFIAGTEKTEGITAMAVSPNKKYVAVAERAAEGEKALVTIFDLHTQAAEGAAGGVGGRSRRSSFASPSRPTRRGCSRRAARPTDARTREKAKVGAVSKTSTQQNAAIYECCSTRSTTRSSA